MREVRIWLGSILVGSLTTYPQLTCLVVYVMTCYLQDCCSVVMVDGPTGSNSLERLKLCSWMVSSRRRNVGWVSCCVVVGGVRNEIIHPRTVSCRIGQLTGRELLPHRSISWNSSGPMSRSMLSVWSKCSSFNLLSLEIFQVLVPNLVDVVVQVMWDKLEQLCVVCLSVCLDLKCIEKM